MLVMLATAVVMTAPHHTFKSYLIADIFQHELKSEIALVDHCHCHILSSYIINMIQSLSKYRGTSKSLEQTCLRRTELLSSKF